KNAIKIIKKEKHGDNYAIDLELQTKSSSPFLHAQNPIKCVQIRVIKNTANTDITKEEIKLYNEYANAINDIAKANPNLFLEAFKQKKLKLSNLCKPKSLGTKVNDFCNAINNCCNEAPDIPFSDIFTKDCSSLLKKLEAKNAEEKRKSIRYNQILDEDVEILYDCGKPYDPRRELSRDYSKCQKLSYDSVIISTINERWRVALVNWWI
uniref:Uncharacterized protein n=1 Tax=Panagrolaimus sp. PS1159 TaxID=55785 RepID=A0AC35F9L2_9BILA